MIPPWTPHPGPSVQPETLSALPKRSVRLQGCEGYGERLAAEGEICWGGMHSWKRMIGLLEQVGRPKKLGFQADMAHTLLFTLGYNAPETISSRGYDWSDDGSWTARIDTMTARCAVDHRFPCRAKRRTVKGSGSHDKTGRHCLPDDPNGKMDIVEVAGQWLRDDSGQPTRGLQHICWDGCMFPNEMMTPQTWRTIQRR